jgi:hypothetical protein
MKATAIEVTADRATVVLTPSWLARLFGAREVAVELRKIGIYWITSATGDPMVRGVPREDLILDALDFRPRTELPAATARSVAAAPHTTNRSIP